MTTGDVAAPAARELRRWLRGVRRTHANRTVWRQLEDTYVWVFGTVMVAAMAGNVVRGLNVRAATCTGAGCAELRAVLPIVVAPVAIGALLRVLAAIGPVSASRATGAWLLASPMGRRALLAPAFWLVTTVAAATGIPAAALGWGVSGASWRALLVAAALLLATAAGAAGAAVLGQADQRSGRRVLWFADGLLVLGAVPVALLALGVPVELASARSVPVLLVVAALVAGGAVVLLRTSWSRLDQLRRATIVAGGEFVAGLSGAAASLDVGLFADIAADRRWRDVVSLTSVPGRFTGVLAVVHRDLRRSLRSGRQLVVGAALLLVPYGVAGVGVASAVPIVAVIACFVAARPLTYGLRLLTRSAAFRRSLPLSARTLQLALAFVPGGFALVWSLLAAPALDGFVPAVVVALAATIGVVRQATALPPDFSGPLLATPMGAIPPGLMSKPLRGPIATVVAILPLLMGAWPWLSILVPATLLVVVLTLRPKT